uniref:Uncharacterized protein n=1 Tax=Meloidogyne incognita TaxID=6306 RepID=A0A914NK37_MELIC
MDKTEAQLRYSNALMNSADERRDDQQRTLAAAAQRNRAAEQKKPLTKRVTMGAKRGGDGNGATGDSDSHNAARAENISYFLSLLRSYTAENGDDLSVLELNALRDLAFIIQRFGFHHQSRLVEQQEEILKYDNTRMKSRRRRCCQTSCVHIYGADVIYSILKRNVTHYLLFLYHIVQDLCIGVLHWIMVLNSLLIIAFPSLHCLMLIYKIVYSVMMALKLNKSSRPPLTKLLVLMLWKYALLQMMNFHDDITKWFDGDSSHSVLIHKTGVCSFNVRYSQFRKQMDRLKSTQTKDLVISQVRHELYGILQKTFRQLNHHDVRRTSVANGCYLMALELQQLHKKIYLKKCS